MKMLLYFLHSIISKIGNKITSIAILFVLISNFSESSLSISILLFSIDPIINILFSRIYSKFISRYDNFNILIFLDFINSILIFFVFLFNKNIISMVFFYFLLSTVLNLSKRYDKGMFFKLTKNTKKEEWYYKINARIDTILSIISPSISSFIISKMGNENAFIIDSVSFILGAIIYLFVCDKVSRIKAENLESKRTLSNEVVKHQFFEILKTCTLDFKFICILFISVTFITNFEEPLIFNYLSLNRNFSKELVGITLSLFSLGMFAGSFVYDYIPKNPYILFEAVCFDGFFSFLLSMDINKNLIILFYMCQGIMAVIIMIYFNVMIQNEFETSDTFMQFQNQLQKILSICTLVSYLCGFLFSNIISDSSLFFKILSVLEIVVAIFCLLKWKTSNKNILGG